MIENKIQELINVVLSNTNKKMISKINRTDSLRSDYGLDSLDLAELTIRIESEYGIDIFEDGIVDTVEEIIRKIDVK